MGALVQYKVIPFDPGVGRNDATAFAATQLEQLIASVSGDGWEFVELSNYSTVVPGSAGCFGFGATSAYPKTTSMAVFRK